MAQLAWTTDVNPFLDIFKPKLAGKHTFVVRMQAGVQTQSPVRAHLLVLLMYWVLLVCFCRNVFPPGTKSVLEHIWAVNQCGFAVTMLLLDQLSGQDTHRM